MAAPQQIHWSRVQERGSLLGLRLVVRCFQIFGRGMTLPLVHAAAAYFLVFDARSRAASHQYLARLERFLVATGRSAPRATRWRSFLQYREFALSIIDRVAMWGGAERQFRFDFHGRGHFEKLAAEGRGAIVIGAHLGSFDALRILSRLDGVKVSVLMHTQHAPRINRIFRELCPDVDLSVLPVDPASPNAAFAIRARVERGEWVAILGDRVEPGVRQRTCEVEFLGERALLPEAPFALPSLLGCPALLMLALRRGASEYAVFAELLVDPSDDAPPANRAQRAREVANAYAKRLEHYCTLAPLQWFNFFDFWAGARR